MLGNKWEHQVFGKTLKATGDSFLKKLNTEAIFTRWFESVQRLLKSDRADSDFGLERPVYPILRIVEAEAPLGVRGGGGKEAEAEEAGIPTLAVAVRFNPQVARLFKEVHSLTWLDYGIRLPFKIKAAAMAGKERYPFAIGLKEALRRARCCWTGTPDLAPRR